VSGVDATTWDALGLTLTVVGVAISAVVWRRRGAAAGLRGLAWSLLPLAAGLTGVLRLLWEIGDAVARWALRLVFSPVVWLGMLLAGTALVLFVVSGVLRRRGIGVRRSQRTLAASPSRAAGANRGAESGADSGAITRTRTGQDTDEGSGDMDDMDDMDEIAAILRRHGIS